jgi:SAM-dependent methyltransferase
MSEDRYDLDIAYTEIFFGWGDNAAQQKVLAKYFVPKIIDKFNPKCVFDVGCGTGQWLDEYRKYNVLTKGVEGSSNAFIEMSEETKDNVLQWDLRDKIEEEDYDVDFVQSFEVAEHIEEEYADVFVHNLIKDDPDIVLLTAAPAGQEGGGVQHVNCQERYYWMKKMKDKDYLFNQDLLNEIKDWGAPKDCPFWWPSNLMVFI